MVLGVKEFGCPNLNQLKEILQKVDNILLNSLEEYGKAGLVLFQELYKYMGKSVEKHVKILPKTLQMKMKKFVITWGKKVLKGRLENKKNFEVSNFWDKYSD